MELRHLRYFVAVAEECHFGRAAERLQIEQSPLSRAVRELESDLGAQLFERTTRRTSITDAGRVLLEEARRIFEALDQARHKVCAAAQGHRGQVRIGVSEGAAAQSRLARLFTAFRHDEPEVDLQLCQLPFRQQVQSLRNDLLDIGLAMRIPSDEGIIADPLWNDPIVVVLPANHSLATRSRLRLADVATLPLLLGDPDCGSGCQWQVEQLIRRVCERPNIVERVDSLSVMLTLVAAGFGVGFTSAAEVEYNRRPDIMIRPLVDKRAKLTTYLLRSECEASGAVKRFLQMFKFITIR